MGYVPFKEAQNYDQFNDYWELRVHIVPDAVDVSNPRNQIEVIKKILTEVFGQDNVGLKIYAIQDENDKRDGYDGALSQGGKDRTQVGKEVGIFLPDGAVQQLSAAEYKKKLLLLWKKLEQAEVPLTCMNVPGDQSIMIEGHLPSPFSFTSKYPNREEWYDPHGILFKEFHAASQHPILGVEFTMNDIRQNKLDLVEPVSNTERQLKDHKTEVDNAIVQALQFVRDQVQSYSERLNEDNLTLKVLTDLVKTYNVRQSADITPEERAKVSTQFGTELEQNEAYQALLNQYPHHGNSRFDAVVEIQEINARLKDLTEQRIDELIGSMRTNFKTHCDSIVKDFQDKIDRQNLAAGLQDLADDNALRALVEKNPAKMQTIFRQLALIQQEVSANQETVKPTRIQLLTLYKNNRESSRYNYTGFFGSLGRLFGGSNKKEKIDAVDALIEALGNGGKIDKIHLRALKQGTLGALIKDLNINLDGMVAAPSPSQR